MTTKRRILCVEDHQDTCEMLTFALKPSGYEVVSAQTGEDGLSKVLSESFDAILLDVSLPDISGVELCKQIRESEIDIPIIFYSAEAHTDRIEEAMKAGAQAYLTKPVAPSEVEKTIAHLLEIAEPNARFFHLTPFCNSVLECN
jgi:two-component system, OmpR family, alkaline phosphatase synthesis response regulator PhoP